MNKTEFIKTLSEKLDYSIEKCTIINSILEDNFVISKKSKCKIIDNLMNELSVDYDEADNIYNVSIGLINKAIKDKIKHPFKKTNN